MMKVSRRKRRKMRKKGNFKIPTTTIKTSDLIKWKVVLILGNLFVDGMLKERGFTKEEEKKEE